MGIGLFSVLGLGMLAEGCRAQSTHQTERTMEHDSRGWRL